MLTKDQLRTKCVNTSRRYRLVTLRDDSEVRLQSLTRAEQREWRNATKKKDGSTDPNLVEYSNDVLLAMTIVDDQGNVVFTIDEAIHGMFDHWDTQDTTLLVDGAVDHLGLVVDQAKEVEDRKKNSDVTPGKDSSSKNVEG